MAIAERVYESVKGLPAPAAQEVLDFADFLAECEAKREDRAIMLSQQRTLGDWDNDEDDAWNPAPAV
jgi:hypothetical protein